MLLITQDMNSIIDGSGVLHDPNGLDRQELTRLAKERKTVSAFDASKLSKDGYRVLVEDQDYKLPGKCRSLVSIDPLLTTCRP